MSSDLLVDLSDDLGGDDSPGAALDQLKLVPEKQWPQDEPVSVSKSCECQTCLNEFTFQVFLHHGSLALTPTLTEPKDSSLQCVFSMKFPDDFIVIVRVKLEGKPLDSRHFIPQWVFLSLVYCQTTAISAPDHKQNHPLDSKSVEVCPNMEIFVDKNNL